MNHHRRPGLRAPGIAGATTASLAVAGLAGTSYASGNGAAPIAGSVQAPRASAARAGADGFVDVTTPGREVRHTRALTATVPDELVLDTSASGTVRWMARLNGFLTPASTRSPARIALGFVSANAAQLGLVAADLDTFHLHRTYTDITGIRHLYFQQRIGGHTVAHNGLTASVNKAGHLLTLGGAPVSTASPAAAPATRPPTITTPAEALSVTRGSVAAGVDPAQDTATRMVFSTPDGLRPAWETVVMSSAEPADTIIDAVTGEVLLRRPLTNYEHSTGRAFSFFPGATHGGRSVKIDFTRHHWLKANAHKLSGNNSHTFSDVNDNDRSSRSEEVRPKTGSAWSYRLKAFHLPFAKSFCSIPWPCSWNPNQRFSWRVNRAQNATQVFFFVNKWHDHLKAAPIGFTEAAGNFQTRNHSKKGKSHDAVATQTDDGANTAHGLPDGAHIDNANMATPPDGRQPTMQMFLQHFPHTAYSNTGARFSHPNAGDEAHPVYHESTPGLPNRLNVDVQGHSTLGGVQAGAMGEAWSDWYAMDYLVDQHLQRDRPAKADVRLFLYDGAGVDLDRTEPIDCTVGQTARLCNGGLTGHRGGYTYADYARVAGIPEVHGDGEIWAQTLWSLRRAIGSKRSEAVVTRAMELAPYNPSFLDMRNAIIVADNSVYNGKQRATIWKVFAKRGMGFSAGSLGGNDSSPSAAFNVPPKTITFGTITGVVTDADSGDPVPNVNVSLAFQGAGMVNPTVKTGADGSYSLTVPEGDYGKLQVQGQGYSEQEDVQVVGNATTTVDLDVRKDLATKAAGASITTQTGVVFTGCSPRQAVDQNLATGWSTNINTGTSQAPTNHFKAKNFVVRLDQPYDVKDFQVDPSASCGDGASASTGAYHIETSPTGITSTWTPVANGVFTSADNGHLNDITLATPQPDVQFVRFWVDGNQTPSFSTNCPGGAFSGCQYVDLTELEIHGKPSA